MTHSLSQSQQNDLLELLKSRFVQFSSRHPDLQWDQVQARLESDPGKLWSLLQMEDTGGEPDVVGFENNQYIFMDCSPESPLGRRSLCYDREALDARKTAKPKNSALDLAAAMGTEILTEDQYRQLQKLGKFDQKSSSWLLTPPEIRKLGGAIFGDRRYDHVFVYHNGADSYYAARGFRCILRV